jgi:hypothetical protein
MMSVFARLTGTGFFKKPELPEQGPALAGNTMVVLFREREKAGFAPGYPRFPILLYFDENPGNPAN